MRKLAIIGASYLQLPLVKKASELGIQTHCFAWLEGAVCEKFCDFFYDISVTEKTRILEICRDIGVDGVVSIASDVAVPTICFIAENLNLIGNDYSKAALSTNKFLMRKEFEKNGINSPNFHLISDLKQLKQSMFSSYPLIVKPVDRSGSRGVFKVSEEKDLKEAVKRSLKESFIKQAIIEEFIDGTEISVETISWKGQHYVLAITDKVTSGTPYFVELQHHQPSRLSESIKKSVINMTFSALNAISHKFGAAHTEIKITSSGDIFIIEIGARMGGDFIGSDLVYLTTGYDYLKACIEVSLGNFHEPKLANSGYAGVYFLCKEQEQKFHFLMDNLENFIFKSEIQDVDLKSVTCSSDRSGYLIYYSHNKENLLF